MATHERIENDEISVPRPRQGARRFGFAWIFLSAAIALHVADEAMTGFFVGL